MSGECDPRDVAALRGGRFRACRLTEAGLCSAFSQISLQTGSMGARFRVGALKASHCRKMQKDQVVSICEFPLELGARCEGRFEEDKLIQRD